MDTTRKIRFGMRRVSDAMDAEFEKLHCSGVDCIAVADVNGCSDDRFKLCIERDSKSIFIGFTPAWNAESAVDEIDRSNHPKSGYGSKLVNIRHLPEEEGSMCEMANGIAYGKFDLHELRKFFVDVAAAVRIRNAKWKIKMHEELNFATRAFMALNGDVNFWTHEAHEEMRERILFMSEQLGSAEDLDVKRLHSANAFDDVVNCLLRIEKRTGSWDIIMTENEFEAEFHIKGNEIGKAKKIGNQWHIVLNFNDWVNTFGELPPGT